MTISKGLRSKEEILLHAREVLNEEGLGITLSELALKLGTTLGRITYHFPTKDHLFVALANQYEDAQDKARGERSSADYGFNLFVRRASEAMDIQYAYRCVMRFMSTSVKKQSAVFDHISGRFKRNRDLIGGVFEALVHHGSLHESILAPQNMDVVLFQFTNLFTSWTINLEIYDGEKLYLERKPVYLSGIFACFKPYLTEKGRAELHSEGMLYR